MIDHFGKIVARAASEFCAYMSSTILPKGATMLPAGIGRRFTDASTLWCFSLDGCVNVMVLLRR